MMLFARSRRRRLSGRVKARLADLPVVNRGGSEELEALDAWWRELRATTFTVQRVAEKMGVNPEKAELSE